MAKPWGRNKGFEGVAKAVRAIPNQTLRSWGVTKALGAWPKPWGRGQGRGGVAKAVGAWPRLWVRLWVRGQGLGGMAKAVSA